MYGRKLSSQKPKIINHLQQQQYQHHHQQLQPFWKHHHQQQHQHQQQQQKRYHHQHHQQKMEIKAATHTKIATTGTIKVMVPRPTLSSLSSLSNSTLIRPTQSFLPRSSILPSQMTISKSQLQLPQSQRSQQSTILQSPLPAPLIRSPQSPIVPLFTKISPLLTMHQKQNKIQQNQPLSMYDYSLQR